MGALLAGIITWAMSGAVASILVGGGLALVVATGLDLIITSFLDDAMTALGGMPADALAVSLLFGWGEALSIVGAALLTRVGIMATANVIGLRRGA